jgi:hypothetical protein
MSSPMNQSNMLLVVADSSGQNEYICIISLETLFYLINQAINLEKR